MLPLPAECCAPNPARHDVLVKWPGCPCGGEAQSIGSRSGAYRAAQRASTMRFLLHHRQDSRHNSAIARGSPASELAKKRTLIIPIRSLEPDVNRNNAGGTNKRRRKPEYIEAAAPSRRLALAICPHNTEREFNAARGDSYIIHDDGFAGDFANWQSNVPFRYPRRDPTTLGFRSG